MTKYKIYVDETRTLRHTVILETEEYKIDGALNEVKDGTMLDDVVGILEREECTVIEVVEDDNGDSEFDVDEYEEMLGGEI
jgi:hypothetical protein